MVELEQNIATVRKQLDEAESAKRASREEARLARE